MLWIAGVWGLIWGVLPAHAQVSPNIPPTDPIYRDLRRLEAEGLLDSLFIAIRPLSRHEVARLLDQAMAKHRAEHPGEEHALLSDLQKRYGFSSLPDTVRGWRGWWGVMQLRTLEVGYLGLREPPRLVPETNAVATPFLREREGRRYDQGDNISLEAGGAWQITPWAAAWGQARWQNHVQHPGGGHAQLLSLYLKTRLAGPLVLQLGRDTIAWGYNQTGSLSIGANAKAFDMAKLSTSRPVRAPWIFKHLGPMQPVVFLTHLGNDRTDFDYPYLFGVRLEIAPHRAVRFGAYRWMQLGGQGAPDNTTLGIIGDFFGIRPGVDFEPGDTFRNRYINNGAGMETQWRLPLRYDATLFGEVFWEDFSRVKAGGGKLSFIPLPFFDWGVSLSYGFSLWSLLDHNRLGIHLERVDTWWMAYTHSLYKSGLTYERAIIGHELGPSGNGWYVQVTSQATRNLFGALGLDVEWRGQSQKITERRIRISPAVDWNIPSKVQCAFRAGYEWVKDFNFVAGQNQRNSLVEMRLRYYY
jgi:hypothetical protein